MKSPSDETRRANRRFWLGIVGFLALMAVILGLGLICAKEEPAEIENAVIVFRTDNVRA
jgi:hypothetical protein